MKAHATANATTNDYTLTVVRSDTANLSKREWDVARNILEGKTAREIAIQLYISPRTVERHIENIKIKLHCVNKIEIVRRLMHTA